MADRPIDREAHRRDPPTPVPSGPSGEQWQSGGQPTPDQALLSENIHARAVSDFPVRDAPSEAKAREPEMDRPYPCRDRGLILRPSAGFPNHISIIQPHAGAILSTTPFSG